MRFYRAAIYIIILFLSAWSQGSAFPKTGLISQNTQDTSKYISPFYEENEKCFICHGQQMYEYTNENLGRKVKELMCTERRVDRDLFYQSNHKSFSCTDCHSYDYETFPHAGELRMEQKYNCIDCHGGDDTFAEFHFEEIQAEYEKSTHFQLEEDGFSCWKCHNPHTYKISIRNTENLKATIRYDNSICLSCHANFDQFQLLSDRAEINILKTHDWLPNQAAHFQNVRCIECHTKISNDILVAHQIEPMEDAVRRCNECHSQNSILMTTLYKFQSREQRGNGFFNGIILNESYVIGANRNEFLNLISIIILLATLGVIVIHILFRIKNKG